MTTTLPDLDILEKTRAKNTLIAYKKAGIEEKNWQPALGYKANRQVLDRLYYYYQELYFRSPDRFLWCGLARLTGGQVLFGMDNLIKICKDPCAITCHISAIAKDIFEAMAWQHELYLSDHCYLLQICNLLDKKKPATHRYESCWNHILQGQKNEISRGNKMLLENEQNNTVQPHYEEIRKDSYSAPYFWFTRFVMRNIHPHHRRFIFSVPFKDVTVFKYRWQWIDGSKGMWQTWVTASQDERNRLVALSNKEVIHHHW
jgi:hypothetical protein